MGAPAGSVLETLQRAYETAIEADGGYVTLVGDVMLDLWIRGYVSRMSPEDDQCPVLLQDEAEMSLGGAGLVFKHLEGMGLPAVKFVTVGGTDEQTLLTSLLGSVSAHVVHDAKRPTTMKSRVIVKAGKPLVRVDRESTTGITGRVQARVLGHLRDTIGPKCRLVVISDYGKGVVTDAVMATIRRRCEEFKVPFIVDPAKKTVDLYEGAALLTPNTEEYRALMITGAGEVGATCVTHGKLGMELYRDFECRKYPGTDDKCVDAIGAGDVVIAAIAVFMAGGAPLELAVQMANAIAGWYVAQEGTISPTPQTVRKLMAQHAQWFEMPAKTA